MLLSNHTFSDGQKFTIPASTASPAVPATTAYNTCAHDGVCDTGAAPDISIASVTLPDIKDAAGNVVDNRLAYVLTWDKEPCAAAGPASPRTTTCTLYNIVDAATGNVLYSEQHSN